MSLFNCMCSRSLEKSLMLHQTVTLSGVSHRAMWTPACQVLLIKYCCFSKYTCYLQIVAALTLSRLNWDVLYLT